MTMQTVGWQLDCFSAATPVKVKVPRPDPFPAPHLWSEAIREQLTDALIALACDSRRGVNLPESLIDCAEMLRARMTTGARDEDYEMTLGWIFQYWDGAIPYRYICSISGVNPEVLMDVVLGSPILKRDLERVGRMKFGTLV